MEPVPPPAYELIPLLMVVLLVGMIALIYSIYADFGRDDEPEIDVDHGGSDMVLHPHSSVEWRREDLP